MKTFSPESFHLFQVSPQARPLQGPLVPYLKDGVIQQGFIGDHLRGYFDFYESLSDKAMTALPSSRFSPPVRSVSLPDTRNPQHFWTFSQASAQGLIRSRSVETPIKNRIELWDQSTDPVHKFRCVWMDTTFVSVSSNNHRLSGTQGFLDDPKNSISSLILDGAFEFWSEQAEGLDHTVESHAWPAFKTSEQRTILSRVLSSLFVYLFPDVPDILSGKFEWNLTKFNVDPSSILKKGLRAQKKATTWGMTIPKKLMPNGPAYVNARSARFPRMQVEIDSSCAPSEPFRIRTRQDLSPTAEARFNPRLVEVFRRAVNEIENVERNESKP